MPLFCEPPKGELKYPPTNLSKINHKGEWSLNNDQISPLFSGFPFIDNSRHVQNLANFFVFGAAQRSSGQHC